MPTIFIVEDDTILRDELARILQLSGFACSACVDFDDVVSDVIAATPDCVVLDLKLPGISGHDVCRELRRQSDVPVLMLTSSDSDFDELMSMNLGADDYISKPYNPAVLVARIQAILRRTNRLGSSTLAHRGLVLDTARATASFDGKTVELTRNEVKILHLLMTHPGQIIERHEIMNELWMSDAFVDDNTLTVNVNRLRKSLAKIGVHDYLTTRRGLGYLV